MRAARWSRWLLRVQAPWKFSSRAASMLGSSSKLVRLRGLDEGLSAHENFFLLWRGLLVLPLFFTSCGLGVPKLLQRKSGSCSSLDVNWISPTSIGLEVRALICQWVGRWQRKIHSPEKRSSLLMFVALQRTNRSSQQLFWSAKIWTWERRRTLSQGSKAAQLQVSTPESIAAFSMVLPDAEKKQRCGNWRLLTYSFTQAIVEATSWRRMVTWSYLTTKCRKGLALRQPEQLFEKSEDGAHEHQR